MSKDTIYRQDAIDAFSKYEDTDLVKAKYIMEILEELPSIETEPERKSFGQLASEAMATVLEALREGEERAERSDCISRHAAIDTLKTLEEPAPTAQHLSAIYDCEDAIARLPSTQPERKTGRWEFQGDRMFMCTCCCYLTSQEQLESWRAKKTDSAFPLFCPNCGASMGGEQDG